MYIFFLLIWIIFNGKVTLEIFLFGTVFSALLYVFFCKFMGYDPHNDRKLLRNLPRAVLYALRLILEVIVANFQIIKLVLSSRIYIEPTLIYFKTGLKSDLAKAALANSITLTPGTITCNLADDGTFLVHCIDKEMAQGITDSVFIHMLTKMEKNQ